MTSTAEARHVSRRLTPLIRGFLLVLVVVAQAGLLVWAGTIPVDPDTHHYPSGYNLALDYDRFVGQRAEVSGDVVSTDPIVITDSFGSHELRMTIHGTDVEPAPGDHLRAFGVVEEGHSLEATSAFTVPRTRLWYTWLVSFAAGLWVLARGLTHWDVDRAVWGLIPQGDRNA